MFMDCLCAKGFMSIISYVGIIPTLLMREPGLREVKPLASHQTSSQRWCQQWYRILLCTGIFQILHGFSCAQVGWQPLGARQEGAPSPPRTAQGTEFALRRGDSRESQHSGVRLWGGRNRPVHGAHPHTQQAFLGPSLRIPASSQRRRPGMRNRVSKDWT